MRLIAFTLIALVAATCSQATKADDTENRSPELQVLDYFVGTWDIEVTAKPTGGEASSFKAVSIRKWSQGAKFVVFDDPGQDELHLVITFDPKSKKYPGIMMAGLSRGLVTCTWDEETRTMKFAIDNTDGSKYRGTHRFIDKNHAEASGVITNSAGEDLLKLSYKQTRRKSEPTDDSAMRIEFRPAETQPSDKLIEAQVQGTDENIYLHKTVVATNNDIEQVKVVLDERRMPAIAITFTDRGAKKIGEASDKYLGKRMAILVDGQAISAPTIRARISNRAEISGNFSHEEATRIAEALNAE